VLVWGLYSSALARLKLLYPPATRTRPLGNSVAVAYSRPVARLPAAEKELVCGLYSSALASQPLLAMPPAPRTRRLRDSAAVADPRPLARPPAAEKVLFWGLYSSALAR